MAARRRPDPASLIDLERYPLFGGGGRLRMVAEAREDMRRDGSAVLPGFVRPEGVALMVAEAAALAPVSHRRQRMLGAYPEPVPAGLDEAHPMRRVSPYRMNVAATDQMRRDGATLAIYEWPPLTRLVADILELEELHTVADPLMRCNFTFLRDGDEHGWHFDGNDFVVSLMVQRPEQGGLFEFAPGIRDERSQNFDAVRAVMDGTPGTTRLIEAGPGTLALFRGRRSLHRVTRVGGARARIMALFSYDLRPGLVNGPDAQRRVFGRAAGEAVVP